MSKTASVFDGSVSVEEGSLDPGDRLPRKLHYIDFSHSSKINYGCDTLIRHRIHLLPAPARHHPSPL